MGLVRTDGATLPRVADFAAGVESLIPAHLRRTSAFLTHPVFNTHHSETEMLRYIRSLSDKDLALDRSMIPLGSCTMKLNATSGDDPHHLAGVRGLCTPSRPGPTGRLRGAGPLNVASTDWLCQATGYAGISLQPNAGSQGEYAGLLAIKAAGMRAAAKPIAPYLPDPESAHGTNPASAQMVGMRWSSPSATRKATSTWPT